jgi:hypothetical protein
MKFRFSIRVLLGIYMLLVAFCVWRNEPRRNAERFKIFIESAQFEAADAMFIEDDERIIAAFASFSEKSKIEVKSLAQTSSQWLRGIYPIAVVLHHPAGGGFGPNSESTVLCVAAEARGVKQILAFNNDLRTAQKYLDQYL